MSCDGSLKIDDDDHGIMFLTNSEVNFNNGDVTTSFPTTITGKPLPNSKNIFANHEILHGNLIETLGGKCATIETDANVNTEDSEDASRIVKCELRALNSICTNTTNVSTDVSNSSGDQQNLAQINSFEDREFEFLRSSPTIQRSTSLKQPKKGDGTDTSGVARKTVRFADALGLDLTSIRHIINTDEPPVVPSCAYRTYARKEEPVANEEVAFWRVRFVQPVVTSSEFRQRVHDRKVALESCSINNQDLTAHGVIRVSNIAFVKDVKVRFSYNGWLTQQDVQAKYIANSNDLVSDRFYFVFHLPGHLGVRNRIEFAILYTANGETWWDSNLGYNYSVECIHYIGQ